MTEFIRTVIYLSHCDAFKIKNALAKAAGISRKYIFVKDTSAFKNTEMTEIVVFGNYLYRKYICEALDFNGIQNMRLSHDPKVPLNDRVYSTVVSVRELKKSKLLAS